MGNKVIIINGPSCAGKSTICKKICEISKNDYAHLQIDRLSLFSATIFPENFPFSKKVKSFNQDIKANSEFNEDRLARRILIASMLVANAKELLQQGINVIIDTAIDGPDAIKLAKLYVDGFNAYSTKFVGIYCPLEERLKRLKTRQDNLFLTEDFVTKQTYEYNTFELCKDFYDTWFDSSLLDSEDIANNILKLFDR